MLDRAQAAERFAKLEGKAARGIPDLRQDAEIKAATQKVADLEAQLAAIKAAITAAERQPKDLRTGRDLDAEKILAGKPLESQPPAGDLEELRRRRAATERAIEMQQVELNGITIRVARDACDKIAPLAAKYGAAIVSALDALEDALEGLNCFANFLSSRGFKPRLRPAAWGILPIDTQLLHLAGIVAASRRQGFGLPAKK
jgi:hypothetical protein